MVLRFLDPEVKVAVGFLGQRDEVVEGGGVAIAGTGGARSLGALEAAANLGVQHLIDQLLKQEVANADEEMEGVEEDLGKLYHGQQGLRAVSKL